MDNEQSKTLKGHINEMESAIATAENGGDVQRHYLAARKSLTSAIALACEAPDGYQRTPLSDLLELAANNRKGRRDSAILVVRALSIDGLLPFEQDHALDRKVVSLVEEGFGDQLRTLKLAEKRQTYEKLNALRGLHEKICENLRVLKELPPDLGEINNLVEDILRALRHGPCNAYLQPFDWNLLKSKIIRICEQIDHLVLCKDASYKVQFDQLVESCNDLKGTAASSPSFLHRKYVAPFSTSVESAIQALGSGAERFACTIEPRRKPPNVAEKRYPLHQVNKLLTITIPLVNSGPGMAVDVTVELGTGNNNSLLLDSEEFRLGDIPPGEFAVSFQALVVEPTQKVDLVMQINWDQLFGDSRSIALNVRLDAQDPGVNWSRLEKLDPYSLEVAEEDNFVGRIAKVQAIGNRLLTPQMTSTYITGQKRIGKTSLAQAVQRYVVSQAKNPITYETFYLEWGEWSAADALSTVKALGTQLFDFLSLHLPDDVRSPEPLFEGSLAPLNAMAKVLESKCPNKRFVIILDEFDEIHPEMYRFGALAEAFFSNLRTLAARKNLAFILVGGEKMPFIIGAQGDQLNKFVREPLDYFSRSDEWADYVELVTGPVRGSLNWTESALNKLFSLTNGHPYYTKLLCAKIFATAVAQRDTEIITSDIRHALNSKISELDTNSFAHFWKDGINAEREGAEVIELKRLRVLVAFGRAIRVTRATRVTISEHVDGHLLQPGAVGPLIEDFCRRDIMKEMEGAIFMQLPIFQRWIADVGVTKLVTSTLADDLESELEKTDDAAYVTAGEIEALVKSWPLYRGQRVTGEMVRAWLQQIPQPQEQRLLFKLLQNLFFVTTPQIAERLRNTHEEVVLRVLPERMRERKNEKRRDLLVTYLDGPGKSGATYARAYAKENNLLLECVVEPEKMSRRLNTQGEISDGLIIVDDLSGTGRTLSGALSKFLVENGSTLGLKKIPLFVIVLFATEEAEKSILDVLGRFPTVESKLHVSEILGSERRAFRSDTAGFWADESQRDRAKALCVRLGTGLYKDALGFGSQALMITFPETCPNNCLPIIFSSRAGLNPWNALLQRPVS